MRKSEALPERLERLRATLRRDLSPAMAYRAQLLERLIERPGMARTWRKLDRANNDPHVFHRLILAIEQALREFERERETREQKRDRHRDLARRLREVATRVAGSAVADWEPPGMPGVLSEYRAIIDGFAWPAPPDKRQRPAAQLLRALAVEAERAAERAMTEPRRIDKPGKSGASRVFRIELMDFFRHETGQRMQASADRIAEALGIRGSDEGGSSYDLSR